MAKARSKAKAVEAPATTPPAAPTEAPQTPLEPVQLTVADLQLVARIVDLASRRGAFQASELKQVGETYDKLAAFLAYVESTQEKKDNPDENQG